jgi:hypothetical protein
MTEPDEALLWAFEDDATRWVDSHPDLAYADEMEAAAEAYRAGQAASAERIKMLEDIAGHAQKRANDHGEQLLDAYERIKALEGGLQQIADDFNDAIQVDYKNATGSLNKAAAARYLNKAPAQKSAVLAAFEIIRNLLKEADQ